MKSAVSMAMALLLCAASSIAVGCQYRNPRMARDRVEYLAMDDRIDAAIDAVRAFRANEYPHQHNINDGVAGETYRLDDVIVMVIQAHSHQSMGDAGAAASHCAYILQLNRRLSWASDAGYVRHKDHNSVAKGIMEWSEEGRFTGMLIMPLPGLLDRIERDGVYVVSYYIAFVIADNERLKYGDQVVFAFPHGSCGVDISGFSNPRLLGPHDIAQAHHGE